MSSDADLIRMANQIAAFYVAYPHDEGLSGVKQHIKDFWEPRMRRAFDALIAKGGQGLSPLALEAGQALLRERAATQDLG
jgi:formate dehydrogenase subunit delta